MESDTWVVHGACHASPEAVWARAGAPPDAGFSFPLVFQELPPPAGREMKRGSRLAACSGQFQGRLGSSLSDSGHQLIACADNGLGRTLLVYELLVGRLPSGAHEKSVPMGEELVGIPLIPVLAPKHVDIAFIVHRYRALYLLYFALAARWQRGMASHGRRSLREKGGLRSER